jgi:hypothetical protein
MNIFQVQKQARRAKAGRELITRILDTPSSRKRLTWKQVQNLRTHFEILGKGLAAARRWIGMYNAYPGAKPYRCSLPKKQQRKLGILPPVEVLLARAA